MQSPEEFIDELFHMKEPYDPVKRHQYYLKTRKLKGRTAGDHRTAVARHPTTRFAAPKTLPTLPPKKSAEQRRKEVEAHVAALRDRLAKLQRVLAELVAQAKLRSGVKPTEKSTPSDKPAQKLNAKQKADAAERSKDFREAHKNDPSEQEKALEAKIKLVETKIREMRAELAKAKARVIKKATPFERGTKLPSKPDSVGAKHNSR